MQLTTTESRSLRRSYVRTRILLLLLTRGPLHASELTDLAGLDAWRMRLALHGDDEAYRCDLALVPLGLVEALRRRDELVYRLTKRGRYVAAAQFAHRRGRGWA